MSREERIKKTTVREKSRNIIPVIPPLRPMGRNTAMVVKLDAVIEVITSEVPKTQLSYRLCPSPA